MFHRSLFRHHRPSPSTTPAIGRGVRAYGQPAPNAGPWLQFGDGVLPENIAYAGPNTTRIDLWTRWPAMLAGLQSLGEMLVLTRNEHAVLGRYMTYPELKFDAVTGCGWDEEGDFDFDLRCWSRAFARCEQTAEGRIYKAEFLDARRQAFHAAVLTPASHTGAFAEWVQTHQAVGNEPPAIWPDEPEIPGESEISDRDHRDFSPSALLPLFGELVRREQPMRALVGHDGAVQSHSFIPHRTRTTGPWLFCTSDDTALHFDTSGVAAVKLHALEMGGYRCWSLKAYHPNGRLLFILTPSTPAQRQDWNRLVHSLAH